jgi:hypothetical protein
LAKRLLIAGALLTIAASLTIEVSLLLFFTDLPRAGLRATITTGIAGVALGTLLMWLARRWSRTG